jgi:hypothetical protein
LHAARDACATSPHPTPIVPPAPALLRLRAPSDKQLQDLRKAKAYAQAA